MRHTHTHSHTHTRPQVCLADLMDAEGDYTNRKVTLKAEDVQGRNVITNFHGMSLTTDKLKSLLAKWCTLVEGSLEVKTSDGYTLRVFAIGFTKKRRSQVRLAHTRSHCSTFDHTQVKKNCHCQTSHVKKIRTKMAEIITNTVTRNPLDKVVEILREDVMGTEIAKACNGIFPLRDVHIRKVRQCAACPHTTYTHTRRSR